MEIICPDDKTLIVQPGTVWAILLAGILFILAGLFSISASGVENHLTCERAAYGRLTCQLTRTLLGIKLEKEFIANLREARLQTNGIVLVAAFNEYDFARHNLPDNSTYRIVADINTFLQSPEAPRLDVSHRATTSLVWGAPLFLGGLSMLYSGIQSNFATWTFDRRQGLITHRRKTLFGDKVTEYDLRDITDAQIGLVRRRGGTTYYRVELLMDDGAPIPIQQWYTQGKSDKERAIQALRAFLRRPVDKTPPKTEEGPPDR